ncbi:MAG: isoleucine--tRNA ligase [Firmicutes bacterium]|nr:isoleucine--tRNA ligase [Bacillota bacterium]
MSTKTDYQDTLQLPKTDFPMRANLPNREPGMLKNWEEKNYYQKLQEKQIAEGRPTFILHDGPPYANGNIHIGTALNKVLKDFVLRSRSMDGYHTPYVPGWDTHGLPIELRAIKDLGVNREKMSNLEFRQKCAEYAKKFVEIQKEEFKRLGIWGEWDNPYLTLHPEYEARQIEIFGQMVKNGYIYKDLKPVYWCPDCETALAEAEIEYGNHRSPSIYVKFAVKDGLGILPNGSFFVIWTTTPWTIPANLAISVHPDYTYVLVETEKGDLVIAKDLLDSFLNDVGLTAHTIKAEISGAKLDGMICQHPLFDRNSIVIVGDHVTLEAGTGCVHTAPGHGQEDYVIGLKYNLPVFSPVDSKGRFTEEAGKYAGVKLAEGNKLVTQDLDEVGALLKLDFIEHSYPHCWRCKDPIIFRATEQWFASLDGFRKAMLDAIEEVQWVPKWGIERIRNMVADRSDWCISRQRVWGVPIPIFYCECGEAILSEETIQSVADIFRKEGSNAWYAREASELLPDGFTCPKCGGTTFTKENDIMDVWFDSGVSHSAVLHQRTNLSWPADLYLEGSDQHRGWFQSSLATSIAAFNKPPYKAVLTHGFVVDGEGRKMSKSLGNVVEPEQVTKQYGADILRLWVASADYRGDIRVSNEILKQLSDGYRRIRNTARFILGNISDFDPETHSVKYEDLTELDKWALLRLTKLSTRVREAYRNYDFHVMYHDVHQFCAVDLGGFYLDVLKDRLYCDEQDSPRRRSAQTAMFIILNELVKLIAPVLVFTADEIWQAIPLKDKEESVHLTTWDALPAEFNNVSLEAKWNQLLEIRKSVARALEDARNQKKIGSSNEATVTIKAKENLIEQLSSFAGELEILFIVSKVNLVVSEKEIEVEVDVASGEKCERCWRISEDVTAAEDSHQLCPRCTDVLSN